MKRFKNIILVFDPKANTQTAIERAESLAANNAARIMVFSVIKEVPPDISKAMTIVSAKELTDLVIKDYQQQVDDLVANMAKKGIKASGKVINGTPFLEIIRQVLRAKHDLVIIAAEGKSSLTERLFGSTSMHLMRKCPCPVWVVKSSNNNKYRQVMAAVDTTTDSFDKDDVFLNPVIMQLAGSIAQIDDSELHVVQVWSVYGEGYMSTRGGLSEKTIHKVRSITKQQYIMNVEALLHSVGINRATVKKHMPRSENVASSIISLVKNKKIDLLVMGTVSRTGVAGIFIGNTAEKVLNKVNCSVLTVKPEGFVTPVTLDGK